MNSPFYRRAAPAVLGVLLTLFAGCDVGGGGDLEPGRYTYRASHPAPGGDESITMEGVLEIEEARGDTIQGHWEVPQLHPELRVLGDEDGAVVVTAHPIYFGTLRHRIRRTRTGISCSGVYVWVGDGGTERSVLLSCSIGPGAEGVTPRLDTTPMPPVRPSGEDTAGSG
jgi:hypothetical protein